MWPKEASGNKVNGLGVTENHRPVQSYHKHHIFYPFGLAEQWFIHKCMANFKIANWYFKHWMTENVTRLGKIANERQHDTPENWTQKIKGDFVSQCREVIKSYVMGQTTGYWIASWIRNQGYYSSFKGGLSDDHSFTVIPAAIEAGLGQLGKHGSMISDVMGSAFRLTPVLTDMPLISDEARDIGVDDFCGSCQLCTRDCPTDAITKKMVNGNLK